VLLWNPFSTILLDNPAKIAAIRETAPAFLRFLADSLSNYYNWRTGLLSVTPHPDSSDYTTFGIPLHPRARVSFRGGPLRAICQVRFFKLMQRPSSCQIWKPRQSKKQVAWFKHLASEGILPSNIELGMSFILPWEVSDGNEQVARIRLPLWK